MKDMLGSFAYYWLRKGIDKMAAIYWLIAFVVLLGIEAATMALTTIWFAGGALVAFVLALLGVSVQVQLAAFVIVSFILLFFTRPFALKYVNHNTVKTNSESLIGKHAKVTSEVNNTEGTPNRQGRQSMTDRNGRREPKTTERFIRPAHSWK